VKTDSIVRFLIVTVSNVCYVFTFVVDITLNNAFVRYKIIPK